MYHLTFLREGLIFLRQRFYRVLNQCDEDFRANKHREQHHFSFEQVQRLKFCVEQLNLADQLKDTAVSQKSGNSSFYPRKITRTASF